MNRLALLVLVAAAQASVAETVLKGKVLDTDGKPVAGADVGSNWDFGKELRAYDAVKTEPDGTFALTLRYFNAPLALIAMDAARERGAAIVVTADSAATEQSLALAPLVAVKGEFSCTDASLNPVSVSIQWQFRGARAGNLWAQEPKFETKLPPGPWGFWTFSKDLRTFRKEFEAGGEDLDLGAMTIEPSILASLAGKEFPEWTVSDARGAGKTVQPKDYRGKWLLVEFWGFW